AADRAAAQTAKNPFEGNRAAIQDGGAMFRNRCAGCHGPDGRGYLGPDLTGLWASGWTDDRLFDVVRRGVPGTEMPPADSQRVLDRDIWQILAYVRSLGGMAPSQPPAGDVQNGAQIFRANCLSCHMVGAEGGHLGPDLSRIGSGRPRSTLEKKIRGIANYIRPGYEPLTLVTRDGQRIRGVRKNEDEFSIQIMDTRQRLQGYLRTNLVEIVEEKTSVMPAYGPEQLSGRDLDDLLAYLSTLRAPDASRR
ncbi:MAG: c-type cytochrome, partial [Acidobacteria bacterium]|nr:c-type cytochrome [Acidobacteriota bacterium]